MAKRKKISARYRLVILRRDGFKCGYCGRIGRPKGMHVDHLIPVSIGGTNDPFNLMAACAKCNMRRGTKMFVMQFGVDAVYDILNEAYYSDLPIDLIQRTFVTAPDHHTFCSAIWEEIDTRAGRSRFDPLPGGVS